MSKLARPISDDELRGAVVLECSLGELHEEIKALRVERQIQRDLNLALVETLKAFGDLFQEWTDESERRKFLYRSVLKAERQAARLRLPTWFWRPEPDKSLDDMLSWRAKFLIHRQKALLDDVWDLLKEFSTDYASQEPTDAQLAKIIEEAHRCQLQPN